MERGPVTEAFTVTLEIRKRSSDYYSARSADMPGLHVQGPTPHQASNSAVKAVAVLCKLNRKTDVTVTREKRDIRKLRVTPVTPAS